MGIDFRKLDIEAGVVEKSTKEVADPQDIDVETTQKALKTQPKPEQFFVDLDAEAGVGVEPDFAALDTEAGIGIEGEVIHAEPISLEEQYREAAAIARAKRTPEENWLMDKGYPTKAAYLMLEQEDVKYGHKPIKWSSQGLGVRDEEKWAEKVFETNLKKLPRNHPVKVEHREWQKQQDAFMDILVKKGIVKAPKQYTGLWDKFIDSLKSGSYSVAGGLAGTAAAATDAVFWDSTTIANIADDLYERSLDAAPAVGGGWMGYVAEVLGQTLPYMTAAVGASLLSGGTLSGMTVAGIPLTTAQAGVMGSFGVGYAVMGDKAYRDVIEAGGTEFEASLNRLVVGTLNGAVESLQVSHVIRFAKPGKHSVKNLVKLTRNKLWEKALKEGKDLTYEALQLMLREGLEEAIQEMVSIGGLTIAVPETFDARDAAKQVGMAALGGATAGLVLGGAGRIITGRQTTEFDEMIPRRDVSDMPTMIETAEGTIGYESADYGDPIIDSIAEKMNLDYAQASDLFNNLSSSIAKGINKENKDKVVDAITEDLGTKYRKEVIGLSEGFWKDQKQHAQKQVKKLHYWMARTYQTLRTLDGGKDGLLVNVIYKPIKDKVIGAHVANANTMEGLKTFLTKNVPSLGTFFKPNRSIVVNNKSFKLSASQRIEIYLSSLNESNLRHLKANGLSDEQINEIATSLSEEEHEIADWLLEKYGGVWGSIADIYKKQTGTQLGKPENFSPIVTDRDFINFQTDFEESLFDRKMTTKRGLASGELKKRLESNSPLKLSGAIENYMGYMFHTNMYSNLALVAGDVGSILNDRNFQQKMKDATNHDLARDLRKWLADTLSNTTQAETDLADKLVNGLRRNAVTYLLGFNIVTMARQPISTLLAAAVNPRMLPFLVRNLNHLVMNYSAMKEEVYEKSPLVVTRAMEREIKENVARRSPKHALKGTKELREISFAPLQFMDRSTVIVVWKSAYELAFSQGNGEFESRAFADSVVTRTQPMAGFEDLPPAFRGGTMSRLFTAFQNQVNQNYNFWAHDIYNAKKMGRISNAELSYRLLMGHILPAFLLGVMSRGRLPEPKELLADEFGYFVGMYYFLGQWLNSMVRGYSASNISAFSGMDNINRMVSTKDPVKKVTFALKGVGAITGIPLNQPIRTMEGALALWDGETEDVMRLIYSEAQRQGMKEKENDANLARLQGRVSSRKIQRRP